MIFDIDGVLSDAAGRQHFLSEGRKDWTGFFDAAGDDPLVDDVAAMLHLLDPALTIVLLTARPLRIRPQTVAWLERHELRWDLLVMRPDRDFTPASEYKRNVAEALQRVGFDVRLAVEDDLRNVEMFKALGVACVYIHSGYYN